MADENLTKRKFSPTVHCAITEERIADSCRRSSSHCMIAEALREVLPTTMRHISVNLYYANFTDTQRNLRYSYHLPRNAQLALIDFDRGRVPQPFSMTLQRAEKITRKRAGASKKGEPSVTTTSTERKASASRNRKSETAILAAMNDPNAPLNGPAMLTEGSSPHGSPCVVGGQPAPAAVNNFAKNRRFGLRMLAE